MLHPDKLKEFSDAYDMIKYPFGIYKDLVINGQQHTNRFELMGAWKTGSIRISDTGTAFTDSSKIGYRFTNRWGPHAPVGYKTWLYLDQNSEFCNQLPEVFPDDMPETIRVLVHQVGFGFIWAVFAAHICRAAIYPLYDQHVWRAYRYLTSEGTECPSSAPTDWQSYRVYRGFFVGLINHYRKPYWLVDRALWVFGKSVKQFAPTPYTGRDVNLLQNKHDGSESAHTTTLGKAKPFWWTINDTCDLLIKRFFRNRNEPTEKTITHDVINGLLQHLPVNTWFSLANNVEKLASGSEKDGIGRYLYQSEGFSETDAQLASHLATLFYRANIWEYNGKLKGQSFRWRSKRDEWCRLLKAYYLFSLSNDVA